MILSWLKNRRRRKWLAEEPSGEWEAWLQKNIWQYAHLDAPLRKRVCDFVCIVLHEKEWAGGRDFVVTDEMRVTIAGQAALLTLGFGRPYYFDRLQTIILYESPYQPRANPNADFLLGQHNDPLFGLDIRSGEAWQGGPIILSWKTVLQNGRNSRCGQNVVLHEFAHHMDGLDGNTDGSPPLTDYELERRWHRITNIEHQRLLEFARRGEETLLDHYGATNQAEFFAVATECFFTQPHKLSQEHEELFGVLERLFGQDPRRWLPESSQNKSAAQKG